MTNISGETKLNPYKALHPNIALNAIFMEGAGVTTQDLSINNNQGIITTATWTDKPGYSLLFASEDYTGTDYFVEWLTSPALEITENLTLEIFFIGTTMTGDVNHRLCLISKDYLGEYELTSGNMNGLDFYHADGEEPKQYVAGAPWCIEENVWSQVVITRKPTIAGFDVDFFANGVFNRHRTMDRICLASANPVRIGRSVGGHKPLLGEVHMAKIYNEILSPERILNNFYDWKRRYNL